MKISDDELVLLIRQHNEEALGLLFLRYEKIISFFEKKYYYANKNKELDQFDYHQIIINSTILAIKFYQEESSIFYAFWKIVVLRELSHAVKAISTKGRDSDLELISLETFPTEAVYQNYQGLIEDQLKSRIDYEEVKMMLTYLKSNVSKEQTIVISLWMQGYSYDEIAAQLNIKVQRVNYLLSLSFAQLKNKFQS